MNTTIGNMSDAGSSQHGTLLCSFCVQNGWPNLALEKPLDEGDSWDWSWTYEIKAHQLQKSIKESCWWCENLGNAILDKRLYAEEEGTAASYEVEMFFAMSEGHYPPNFGALMVDILGKQDDGEPVLEHRISCGVFADPGENFCLLIAEHKSN
jgi:hypothetical protein